MEKYDLIVIGGGSGGLTAAAGAASFGAKIALIDKRPSLGGDCLHVGCVPSKAFIHQANEFYQAKKGAEKHHVALKASLDSVRKEVEKAIGTIQKSDSDERFEELGIDVFHGAAVFRSMHEVEVCGKILYGKRIVIATGSSPIIPPVEGLKEAGFLTNETVFSLEALPEKLVIMGGGPIGVELGQAFARLGSHVTIIERGKNLLSKEDRDVQSFMQKKLSEELTIKTSTKVKRVSKYGDQRLITVESNGAEEELEADEILVTAGRSPNTASLGLEEIGVEMDSKGHVKVNSYLQTNLKHIYAVGDVIGTYLFTHTAGQEGKTVVQNAMFGVKTKMNYDAVPWNTYTKPEVFHLGLTELEAGQKMNGVKIYKKSLSEVDRFVTEQEDGFVKIITDSKDRIIGAHAVGDGAGDWMQSVVYAMQSGKKISSLSRMVYPYPNKAAAIQQTADLYWREKLFSGTLKKITQPYIKYLR